MFKQTLVIGHSLKFDLFNPASFNKNELDLIVVFFALMTLLFMFLYGICNSYKFDKRFAYLLMTIYASLIAVTTAIAVKQAIGY